MLASDSPSDTEWWCAEWCELISLASLTTAVFSDVHTVFTLPPFFFSVESVASKFRGWWKSTIAMNPELSSKFTLSDHKNCHRFCKTFSQQKHFVLQSTAPLQLKRFKVGSKMAIEASAPMLPNQKKQCWKIAWFADASCTIVVLTIYYTTESLLEIVAFYTKYFSSSRGMKIWNRWFRQPNKLFPFPSLLHAFFFFYGRNTVCHWRT